MPSVSKNRAGGHSFLCIRTILSNYKNKDCKYIMQLL